MRGFNTEKLNSFLKRRLNNIDSHIDTLTAQEVDGEAFLGLTPEDLTKLGILLGPAKKILKLINDIQEASVENLPNLLGQMGISGSSCSVNTSPFSIFIKTVVDNSEITRKNSEAMVRFIKEFNRTKHETASITQAKAYQSTIFESVDVEYFLSKNNTYLGSFQQNGTVNTYLRRNSIPTNTEDNVQECLID
ncbi:hypothetical protein C2G38_2039725 [Gigaspora rosea]|uniref:SAM domain-containing protein n=1 Tax=Gigaspora rosea TaxID=44941 RepID=A0A397V0M2_9GLOM|nr:hypothetical protein C2G38_2039725 [Gigaspora rosea]